jgi:hypothetical protein
LCTSVQVAKYGDAGTGQSVFSFVVDVIESAIKVWHDTGKVDPKVNFLLDDQKTDTEKHAPVVSIDKVAFWYWLLHYATLLHKQSYNLKLGFVLFL